MKENICSIFYINIYHTISINLIKNMTILYTHIGISQTNCCSIAMPIPMIKYGMIYQCAKVNSGKHFQYGKSSRCYPGSIRLT